MISVDRDLRLYQSKAIAAQKAVHDLELAMDELAMDAASTQDERDRLEQRMWSWRCWLAVYERMARFLTQYVEAPVSPHGDLKRSDLKQ